MRQFERTDFPAFKVLTSVRASLTAIGLSLTSSLQISWVSKGGPEGLKLCHPTHIGMHRWLHSLLNNAHPSRGDARTKNIKTTNELSQNQGHQQL